MSYVALESSSSSARRTPTGYWRLRAQDHLGHGVLVREDDPSDPIFFIADGLFEVYVFGGRAGRRSASSAPARSSARSPGSTASRIGDRTRRRDQLRARARASPPSSASSQDPGFAARFFRAIATLIAERLRTDHVRRCAAPRWAQAAPRPRPERPRPQRRRADKVAASSALAAAEDPRRERTAVADEPPPRSARPSTPSSWRAAPRAAECVTGSPIACRRSCCRSSGFARPGALLLLQARAATPATTRPST